MIRKIAILSVLTAASALAALTTVSDTLYNPDGTTVNGSIRLAWPTFYGADGHLVQSGSKTITITSGVLSVNLEPTDSATPTGVVYTATYTITGAPALREYWAVPTSASSVPLSSVRVLNPPTPGPFIPNVISNSITFSSSSQVVAASFNFAAQTPGGTLTASTPATVSLNPCPSGLSGTDVAHWLYVSGGTGTAEPVLVTGGTCAGVGSGTVAFTPANSHSGAWTIRSATGGITEAINALPSAGGTVVANGTFTMYGPVKVKSGTRLHCESGTVLQMTGSQWGGTGVVSSFGMLYNYDNSFHDMMVDGCELAGNGPTPGVAAPGLISFGSGPSIVSAASRVRIEGNYIHDYAGNGATPAGGAAVGLLYASGTGNTFVNNRMAGNGVAGGMLTTGPGVLVSGNQLPGTWSDCGITINNATAVGDIVVDNYVEGTGICTEAVSAGVVSNNVVRNPANNGITIFQDGDDMVITGNSILGVPATFNAIQQTAPCANTLVVTNNHITRAAGTAPNPGSIGLCSPLPAGYLIQAEGWVGGSTSTGPVQFGCSGNATAAATLFLKTTPPSACTNTTEDGSTFFVTPSSSFRTARHLSAFSNGVVTHNVVVTVRANLADSSLTCTILAGAQSCSDTSDSVQLTPGQPVTVKVVTLAGEVAAANILVSLEL